MLLVLGCAAAGSGGGFIVVVVVVVAAAVVVVVVVAMVIQKHKLRTIVALCFKFHSCTGVSCLSRHTEPMVRRQFRSLFSCWLVLND